MTTVKNQETLNFQYARAVSILGPILFPVLPGPKKISGQYI